MTNRKHFQADMKLAEIHDQDWYCLECKDIFPIAVPVESLRWVTRRTQPKRKHMTTCCMRCGSGLVPTKLLSRFIKWMDEPSRKETS